MWITRYWLEGASCRGFANTRWAVAPRSRSAGRQDSENRLAVWSSQNCRDPSSLAGAGRSERTGSSPLGNYMDTCLFWVCSSLAPGHEHLSRRAPLTLHEISAHHSVHHFWEPIVQTLRKFEQNTYCWLFTGNLNQGDIGPIKVAFSSQIFLAHIQLQSSSLDLDS